MVVRNPAFVPGVEILVQDLRTAPDSLREVLAGLESPSAKVKFACSKALRLLSEQAPEMLYAQFDHFVDLLGCGNSFFEWDAARILAELAAVDRDQKIERVIETYLQPIAGPQMIRAAIVMAGGAKIAVAKPHLANLVSHAILRVERAQYQTAECRNIAIGHAIESLDHFYSWIGDKQAVVGFVRRQLKNPRDATRKKAERFLKHWDLQAAGVGSGW